MVDCKNCRHYFETHPETEERPLSAGYCRRFPPQAVQVRPASPVPEGGSQFETENFLWQALFPTVFGNWVCGEFAPRPERVN